MHVQLLIQFILISTKIISFPCILFKQCKGLRNGHNYLFIAEFIEKNRRRGKQTYEIGSFISFGINLSKPFGKIMIEDKHHELHVRSVCTLCHQTWQYDKETHHITWNICHSWQNDSIMFLRFNTYRQLLNWLIHLTINIYWLQINH